MKLKNLQFRMFSSDINDSPIIDYYHPYCSDLFIPYEFEVDDIRDVARDLLERYHAHSVRVWGEGFYDEKYFNDMEYDVKDWKWENWILLHDNHLEPKAVFAFNLLERRILPGVIFDSGTKHELLVVEGEEFDLGETMWINAVDDDGEKGYRWSGVWVWSESKEDLKHFTEMWSSREVREY